MPTRILVVDDESDLQLLVRHKFRHQIQQKELDFRFALNGREALQILKSDAEIEVVLSDINMPEMDGLTLLGHLVQLPRTLKTIVVSAYADMKNIRAAMNRGAFDFLTKPIDFEDVAFTLKKTIEELKMLKAAAAAQRQLSSLQCELDLAARIQQALLPQPPLPGPDLPVEIFAEMLPARNVGGDFYDFFRIGPERIAFLVGDVVGKGVPASLYMAATRTLIRAIASPNLSAGDSLHKLNQSLCRENVPGMFVTLFYGILDTGSGEVEFSIGGHYMPYLLSQGGVCYLSNDSGPVLGLLPDVSYPTATLKLNPGDALVLFTDGAIEACDPREQEFSLDGMRQSLEQCGLVASRNIVAHLLGAIQAYSAGNPQADDITLLALRYLGEVSSGLQRPSDAPSLHATATN